MTLLCHDRSVSQFVFTNILSALNSLMTFYIIYIVNTVDFQICAGHILLRIGYTLLSFEVIIKHVLHAYLSIYVTNTLLVLEQLLKYKKAFKNNKASALFMLA